MEKVIKELQELQLAAFERRVNVFNITTYVWDASLGVSDVITVHVVEKDDDDAFDGYIHEGNDEEAKFVLMQLKLYLGL